MEVGLDIFDYIASTDHDQLVLFFKILSINTMQPGTNQWPLQVTYFSQAPMDAVYQGLRG